MTLLIGAWYNEADYSFDFSYKISNYIRELVKNEIFKEYNLNIIEKEWYLNLIIATDSKIQELEVRGPDRRKRQKMIDYGLWLPYDKIMRAEKPVEKYIDYLFEAFVIVFNNYKVKNEDLCSLKNIAKNEILNSDIYI